MTAITTIRIDHDALPNQFDRSRPDAVAEAIEAAMREDGIMAEASDVLAHQGLAAHDATGRCQRRAGRSAAYLMPPSVTTKH